MDCQSHFDLKAVAGLLLLGIGLILTGSVMLVLLRKSRQTVSNLLVLHLTLVDFLTYLSLGPFFILSLFMRSYVGNPILCQTTAFFSRFTVTLSVYMTTLTGMTRCYSILWPIFHRTNIHKSRINRYSAFGWLSALIISIAPFIGFGEYELVDGQCWCQLNSNKYPFNWFVYLVIVFLLPLIVNTTCYTLVLRKVLVSHKQRKTLANDSAKNEKQSRNLSRPSHALARNAHSNSEKVHASPTDVVDQARPIQKDEPGKLNALRQTHKKVAVDTTDTAVVNKNIPENLKLRIEVKVDVHMDNQGYEEYNDIEPSYQKNTEKVNNALCDVRLTDLTLDENKFTNNIERSISQNESNEEIEANGVSKVIDVTCQEKKAHLTSKERLCRESCSTTESTVLTAQRNEDKINKIEEINCTVLAGISGKREIKKLSQSEKVSYSQSDTTSSAHSSEKAQNQSDRKRKKNNQKGVKKTKHRITCIVSLIFIVHLLFSGQFFVVWSWFAINPDSVPRLAFVIFRYAVGLNPLINSFLYAFVSIEIRRNVLSMWKNIFKRLLCQY